MVENQNISFTLVESVKPTLSEAISITLGVLSLLSLLWGATMKSIVFWHFSQTKIWTKPINVLILADEFIFIISGSYILIQMSVWLFTQTQAVTFFENWFDTQIDSHWYCSVYVSIATFHFFYGTLGSFGFILHRYVFVMKPHWVNGLREERIMLVFILAACLITNVCLVFLNNAGNATRRIAFNACLGRSERFQVLKVATLTLEEVEATQLH